MLSRHKILITLTALFVVAFVTLQAQARTSMTTTTHPECSFCHNLHGTPSSFGGKLFAAKTAEATCLSCHGPAGISTLKAAIHNNSTATYSAFEMTCTVCHDPHVYPDNWRAGENIESIGSTYNNSTSGAGLGTINTPNSGIANVVYESKGTDVADPFNRSFADNDQDGTGDGIYDGVCEVCHTQTKYHRNTSAADHAHNTGRTCTTCHKHDQRFKGEGACVDCHNKSVGSAPDIFRKVTETGGDFVDNTSRHVFGGTVSNWDCIVCHAEGDTSSIGENIVTTTEHNDAGKTIAMRNVDVVGNPGSVGTNFWRWPKPSGTPTDTDYTNMDTFCMRCHDSDSSRGGSLGGASGIAVSDLNNAVTLSPTLAERLRPFNPTDAIDNSAVATTGTAEPGATLTSWFTTQVACEAQGFTWTGSDCTDRRSRVVDVYGQFNTSNPSHHAVLGARYSTQNGSDYLCDLTGDRNCDTSGECTSGCGGTSPIWNSTFNQCVSTSYANQTACEDADKDFAWGFLGWGPGAWVAYTTKGAGQDLLQQREAVTLHCADCHTVDQNAHGSANGFMLSVSSIDGTCYLCHNGTTTYSASATNQDYSRADHTDDSGHTFDTASASLLGAYGGSAGSLCLSCHGGAHYDGYGAIHGIPASPTDTRTGQSRYRFIGGSTMSRKMLSPDNDWTSAGVTTQCYFIDPDPQPWSTCQHHGAGTVSGSNTTYPRLTTY